MRIRLFTTLLLASTLAVCHAPPPDVDDLVERAAIHTRAGEHEAAVEAWRAVLAATPESTRAHLALGAELLALQQTDTALAEFHQAVRTAPRDAQAQGTLGNTLREVGRVREALPVLEEAVHLAPDDARLRWALGDVLLRLERLPEADAAFRRTLELDPDFPPAHYGLGMAQLMRNDRAGALEQHRWLKDHDESLAGVLYENYQRTRGFKTERRPRTPPLSP